MIFTQNFFCASIQVHEKAGQPVIAIVTFEKGEGSGKQMEMSGKQVGNPSIVTFEFESSQLVLGNRWGMSGKQVGKICESSQKAGHSL